MTQKHTLVLMPGLDGTGKLFAPIVPLLQPHFDLMIITYPDLDTFSDYVDCVLNQLPATPGYSLIAEFYSGPVALAVMAQRGDQIGPSVLCSSFARSPLASMSRIANYIPAQMFSIGALDQFCAEVYEVKEEDFTETQPLPMNIAEELDGTLLKHRLQVLSRLDVSALLPGIDIPILHLHGVRDRIVSEQDAQMLEHHLPRVQRVNLDAPHLLLQSQPLQCAELIYNHVTAAH